MLREELVKGRMNPPWMNNCFSDDEMEYQVALAQEGSAEQFRKPKGLQPAYFFERYSTQVREGQPPRPDGELRLQIHGLMTSARPALRDGDYFYRFHDDDDDDQLQLSDDGGEAQGCGPASENTPEKTTI